MTIAYDAGALIAAEANDGRFWRDHRARLERGARPLTTAPVLAQVSRSARQAHLHRLLRGCRIVPFSEEDAHEVGRLLASTGTSDVVDAHLVLIAGPGATIRTSDPFDLRRLAAELPVPPRIRPV